MAISVKAMNGLSAIKAVGIDQLLFDKLASSGIKVTLTSTTLTVALPPLKGAAEGDFDLKLHAFVPVTLNDLQTLKAGTITAAKKGLLRHQIEKAVKEMLDTKDKYGHLLDWSAGVDDEPMLGGALGALPPLKSQPGPSVVVPTMALAAWPEFDMSKLKTATLVPLREATQMYQPVEGTSAGSRYFMVGAGKGVRVACRLRLGTLSVRVEGTGFSQFKAQAAASGMKLSAEHASLHLEVGDDVQLASKTLGAILCGLGITLETPMPMLMKVL